MHKQQASIGFLSVMLLANPLFGYCVKAPSAQVQPTAVMVLSYTRAPFLFAIIPKTAIYPVNHSVHSAPADKQEPRNSTNISDLVGIAESIFTILAIAIGGIWTYMLFVKKRQKYPRARITHSITHRAIHGGRRLLHVATKVSNNGEVLLCLVSGFIRVQQMLPPPREFIEAVDQDKDPVEPGESEYQWPLLEERILDWRTHRHEIEPGEIEEIHSDFVVGADSETLEVYSYFKNDEKSGREIGWNLTTIYDLHLSESQTQQPANQGSDRTTTERNP